MSINLKPNHTIVQVDIDGTPNAWELWKGDAFFHSTVLKAKTCEELISLASLNNLLEIKFS